MMDKKPQQQQKKSNPAQQKNPQQRPATGINSNNKNMPKKPGSL